MLCHWRKLCKYLLPTLYINLLIVKITKQNTDGLNMIRISNMFLWYLYYTSIQECFDHDWQNICCRLINGICHLSCNEVMWVFGCHNFFYFSSTGPWWHVYIPVVYILPIVLDNYVNLIFKSDFIRCLLGYSLPLHCVHYFLWNMFLHIFVSRM